MMVIRTKTHTHRVVFCCVLLSISGWRLIFGRYNNLTERAQFVRSPKQKSDLDRKITKKH